MGRLGDWNGSSWTELGGGLNNLGIAYRALGEYDEAKNLFERALDINRALLDDLLSESQP